MVRPTARAEDQGWPVGGILLLGNAIGTGHGAAETAMAYGSILFRPRILSVLPGHARLRKGLLELARSVPMALVPQVSQFDSGARSARIDQALKAIARLDAK